MQISHKVKQLSTWLINPSKRPQVIPSSPIPSPLKKRTSPRKSNLSPRKTKKKTSPTALEQAAASIAICHQINSLFRAQSSFANAELLAHEFLEYNTNQSTNGNINDNVRIEIQLLECLLDILEEAGPMSHVPLEVLVNLALDIEFKALIAKSEAVEITRALLLAEKHRNTDDGNGLIIKVGNDFILDMMEDVMDKNEKSMNMR